MNPCAAIVPSPTSSPQRPGGSNENSNKVPSTSTYPSRVDVPDLPVIRIGIPLASTRVLTQRCLRRHRRRRRRCSQRHHDHHGALRDLPAHSSPHTVLVGVVHARTRNPAASSVVAQRRAADNPIRSVASRAGDLFEALPHACEGARIPRQSSPPGIGMVCGHARRRGLRTVRLSATLLGWRCQPAGNCGGGEPRMRSVIASASTDTG
jgi:hypothetical protein